MLYSPLTINRVSVSCSVSVVITSLGLINWINHRVLHRQTPPISSTEEYNYSKVGGFVWRVDGSSISARRTATDYPFTLDSVRPPHVPIYAPSHVHGWWSQFCIHFVILNCLNLPHTVFSQMNEYTFWCYYGRWLYTTHRHYCCWGLCLVWIGGDSGI